jgi:hypothetical protein
MRIFICLISATLLFGANIDLDKKKLKSFKIENSEFKKSIMKKQKDYELLNEDDFKKNIKPNKERDDLLKQIDFNPSEQQTKEIMEMQQKLLKNMGQQGYKPY